MRVLLVFNPTAGHGHAGRLLGEVEARCRDLGLSVDLRLTEDRGHATGIVEGARLDAYDGVIAGGGDGTVCEVVNGLFRNAAGPAVPLGVLPIGTGNSFSRDIGLTAGRTLEALGVVADGHTRAVDVGRCRAGSRDFHFINILGLGLVTDVTAAASRLKCLGVGAYTLGVIYRTAFLRTLHLSLEIDGETIERDATFLEISNSRYTADFLMAPEARIDDGLLDVTLLGRLTRRRLLRLFPTVFSGDHVHHDEVETFKARHITITNEHPTALSPDGELAGATPAEVTCMPRALEVFAQPWPTL